MGGEFFETWVVSEIYKSYLNTGQKPPLYFYRDSNKKEIEQEPTEENVFSGAARLKVNVGTGAVVCMCADLIPADKKNWYVPAWLI